METNSLYTLLLKVALVIFMAGNLLDMGLRLHPPDAIRGLRNVRFVLYTLFWGFVVGPVIAVLVANTLPLDPPYAMGLILLGMAPSAPFVPLFVSRAKGDLGYTAAFMLLVSLGTILFMPFAVPLLVKGLSVTAWTIARPLLIMVLLPLAVGMLIRHFTQYAAEKIQPVVKKVTGLFTIITLVLIFVVYGEGIIGVRGSSAVLAQCIFFFVMMGLPYWLGYRLERSEKVVLSIGLSTRNLGAAIAPLFSVAETDPRAFVMVVLALPIMVLFASLAVKWFGHHPSTEDSGKNTLSAKTEQTTEVP